MKIAFLTQQYPHKKTGSSGGIGTAIKNLSQGLLLLQHEVIILIYQQEEDAFFEDEGISFYKIKNVQGKFSGYFTRKKIENLINSLHSQKKIDIVEAPDWTGITSFIKPNCPLVIRENGSDSYFCHLESRPVKWKNRFHEKRALQNANGIISVSKFTGDITNQVFGIFKEFAVIPNSIDINSFKVEKNNEQFPIILYFGNLIRKKGALELALIFNKVIEKNPDAELHLVGQDIVDIETGSTSTWSLMQQLFSDAALTKVHYFGRVDYKDIKLYIRKASVCVFPSFAEALPVSWLEAMAMQKAIVASNIGWANEMIESGKEGYLVDPREHILFAENVLLLLQDWRLRDLVGSRARQKVISHFSTEIVAKKSIEFYTSIINKKK